MTEKSKVRAIGVCHHVSVSAALAHILMGRATGKTDAFVDAIAPPAPEPKIIKPQVPPCCNTGL